MTREDPNFLKHFIDEPVFVIQEEDKSTYDMVEQENQDTTLTTTKQQENQPSSRSEEKIITLDVPSPTIKPTIKFKGENTAEILVIVDDKEVEYISEENEKLLTQILQSINLTINHIAIINCHKISISDAISTIKHKMSFYFVDESVELPGFKDVPLYQFTIDNNDIKKMRCHGLSRIGMDRDLKLKLWGQLKLLVNK